mmetsp:Transcript_25713/g.51857  ORF Transcript_25713/g.51857 Transcript_25713/m.51857 type:complete len:239 (-) Transcript_25713:250-966(-)
MPPGWGTCRRSAASGGRLPRCTAGSGSRRSGPTGTTRRPAPPRRPARCPPRSRGARRAPRATAAPSTSGSCARTRCPSTSATWSCPPPGGACPRSRRRTPSWRRCSRATGAWRSRPASASRGPWTATGARSSRGARPCWPTPARPRASPARGRGRPRRASSWRAARASSGPQRRCRRPAGSCRQRRRCDCRSPPLAATSWRPSCRSSAARCGAAMTWRRLVGSRSAPAQTQEDPTASA